MKRTMVYAAVVAALLCGVLIGRALATEYSSPDSTWWNSLGDSEKLAAVQSMMDASAEGWSNGIVAEGAAFAKRMESFENRNSASRLSAREKGIVVELLQIEISAGHDALAPGFTSYGKTLGTYVHGISDFYDNNPSAESVTVGAVLGCLADKPIKTCEAVAKSARSNRK